MLALLRPPEQAPPPRDWLLARVRARRSLPRPELVPWEAALTEARWLYPRLDADWRQSLAPFCALLEVRPLAMALRLTGKSVTTVPAQALLEDSLLARPLQQLALRPQPWAAKLPALCGRSEIAELLGAEAALAAQGVRQCEALLTDALLCLGRRSSRDPALHCLYGGLIDVRNLLALGKAQRWSPETAPRLLAGGLLTPDPGAVRQRRLPEVRWRWCGRDLGSGAGVLERLLAELGRSLQQQARDPLSLGLVLAHLARLVRPATVPS